MFEFHLRCEAQNVALGSWTELILHCPSWACEKSLFPIISACNAKVTCAPPSVMMVPCHSRSPFGPSHSLASDKSVALEDVDTWICGNFELIWIDVRWIFQFTVWLYVYAILFATFQFFGQHKAKYRYRQHRPTRSCVVTLDLLSFSSFPWILLISWI